MGLEHVGSARFRGYSLAEKSLFGLPGAPVACWSPGGQKAHFRAEKWAWRPLEAIPSGGAVERKVRVVRRDSVAKVSDRFGPSGPLEDDCTGFSGDCTENTGENGPKRAIFGCFLGISTQLVLITMARKGPKRAVLGCFSGISPPGGSETARKLG